MLAVDCRHKLSLQAKRPGKYRGWHIPYEAVLTSLSSPGSPGLTPFVTVEEAVERDLHIIGPLPFCAIAYLPSSEFPARSKGGGASIFKFHAAKDELERYLALPETRTLGNLPLGSSETLERWANATNKPSWQLPRWHPRQNRTFCVALAKEAGRDGKPKEFYHSLRLASERNEHYIIQMHDAIIEERGMVATECGYIQAHDACETRQRFIGRKWMRSCEQRRKRQGLAWKDMFRSPEEHGHVCLRPKLVWANQSSELWRRRPRQHPVPVHDAVIVVDAIWDHNFYHLMVGSLSRLARHYDWLQANPNVLIHMRGFDVVLGNETSFQVRTARSIWQRVFSLLKIDMRRLITGPALARTVYFPRSAPCNLPLSNALEMRVFVHRMLALAHDGPLGDSDLFGVGGLLQPRQSRTGRRPRLVLQHRQCSSSSPCQGWREMDARSFAMLQAALQDHLLPSSMHVMRFDEKDPPEQLRHEVVLYSKTDVVVGFHGAGLANLVFMRPGSLVIEIVQTLMVDTPQSAATTVHWPRPLVSTTCCTILTCRCSTPTTTTLALASAAKIYTCRCPSVS